MNRKKLVIIAAGTFILLSIAIAIAIQYIANYLYRQNGRYYIPKQYSHIALPTALYLRDKNWDDANKSDPSLESVWAYTYNIIGNSKIDKLQQSLQDSLKNEGFHITNELHNKDYPKSYSFNADTSKLSLMVTIGYPCVANENTDYNCVSINASLPADKAHLVF